MHSPRFIMYAKYMYIKIQNLMTCDDMPEVNTVFFKGEKYEEISRDLQWQT